MEILVRHSVAGADTRCTVYYDPFWLGDPGGEAATLPHILRGRLGAHMDLFEQSGYPLSPQNLWPDDHGWVMETDTDSWATTVSGPTDLINHLLACARLEAIRLHDLKRLDELT